jgi:hypothetical protein
MSVRPHFEGKNAFPQAISLIRKRADALDSKLFLEENEAIQRFPGGLVVGICSPCEF